MSRNLQGLGSPSEVSNQPGVKSGKKWIDSIKEKNSVLCKVFATALRSELVQSLELSEIVRSM